jgi:hypothetical protein
MGDGVAQTFKHPHPNECRGPDALLLSHRPQLLQRFRVKAYGDSGRETLGKSSADGLEFVFVVRGAVSIPESCLFLDRGKFGDAHGFRYFLFGHSACHPCCCS